MPKFEFDVVLKVNSASFVKGMKDAVDSIEKLEQKGKNAGTNFSNSMKQTLNPILDIHSGLGKISTALNFLATFSGLNLLINGFGQLVDLAKEAAGAMFDIGKQVINTAADWETSKLGIATVLAMHAKYRDSKGQELDEQAQMNAALLDAENIQKRLLEISLQYPGTVADLQKIFLSTMSSVTKALPVGQGGRAIEDALNLTKGAQALFNAVPLAFKQGIQQVIPELNALLSGNYIGKSALVEQLGIGKEELKAAKEAGTIVEFLEAKFKKVQDMASLSKDTFKGMSTIFTDISQQFQVMLGGPALKSLEGFMHKIVDYFIVIDKTGAHLSPVIQKMADSLNKMFAGSGAMMSQLIGRLIQFVGENPKMFQAMGRLADQLIVNTLLVMMETINLIDAHSDKITSFINLITVMISTWIKYIEPVAKTINSIVNSLDNMIYKLKITLVAISKLKDAYTGNWTMNKLWDTAKSFIDSRKEAAPELADKLAEARANLPVNPLFDPMRPLGGKVAPHTIRDIETGVKKAPLSTSRTSLTNSQIFKILEDMVDATGRLPNDIFSETMHQGLKGKLQVDLNFHNPVTGKSAKASTEMTPQEYAKMKKAVDEYQALASQRTYTRNQADYIGTKTFTNRLNGQ